MSMKTFATKIGELILANLIGWSCVLMFIIMVLCFNSVFGIWNPELLPIVIPT